MSAGGGSILVLIAVNAARAEASVFDRSVGLQGAEKPSLDSNEHSRDGLRRAPAIYLSCVDGSFDPLSVQYA